LKIWNTDSNADERQRRIAVRGEATAIALSREHHQGGDESRDGSRNAL
jgi:hypothetical protein